jgi:hypothetical protein
MARINKSHVVRHNALRRTGEEWTNHKGPHSAQLHNASNALHVFAGEMRVRIALLTARNLVL